MSDRTWHRHGLESLLAELLSPIHPAAGAELHATARVRSGLGFVNLRGRPVDAGFVSAIESVLGQDLPVEPNTVSRGPHDLYWLGPDEWLIAARQPQPAALVADLRDAAAERDASVTDLSGGLVGLVLCGAAAGDILARGCTLDLDPTVFPAGRCAQSAVAKANVLLARAEAEAGEGFELFVRRSFADYLLRWLARAGGKGIGFESE